MKISAFAMILALTLSLPAASLPQEKASYIINTESTPTEEDTTSPDSQSAISGISAQSAVLMEASTGTVLYEQNSHEALRPASITKIMTLILIFEAIEKGQIHMEDVVTVSEYASSMGGSQVYFEPGETQTVETMIKCISIASANDACVAMSEFIAGSEPGFVAMMNEKAASLGMKDTSFVNCCGLEADGHLTSAYDVALMSRELSEKHPEIHNYCTIWMDTIIHNTRKGSSEFGLTNTNKLLRQSDMITGLKTGYTSLAKYCLSATATRDNLNMIAVVMAEPDPKTRNKDAMTLLNYGFTHCQIYEDENTSVLPELIVSGGVEESIAVEYAAPFQYLATDNTSLELIQKELVFQEDLKAPVSKGDVVGKAVYTLDGKEIGSVDLLSRVDLPKAYLKDYYLLVLLEFLMH